MKDEERRREIRKHLRELDEEREAVQEGVTALDFMFTDRCASDEERSKVVRIREDLRSLLPAKEPEK